VELLLSQTLTLVLSLVHVVDNQYIAISGLWPLIPNKLRSFIVIFPFVPLEMIPTITVQVTLTCIHMPTKS
jgi:hypothetical protein